MGDGKYIEVPLELFNELVKSQAKLMAISAIVEANDEITFSKKAVELMLGVNKEDHDGIL